MKEATKKAPNAKGKKAPARLGKKQWIILAVAALLAVALVVGLILLFVPRSPALSLDGVAIDSEMYAFWFSMHKTEFMRKHGLKSTQDTAATWASPCTEEGNEGRTWGEVLNAEVHEAIKTKVAAAAVYDALGITMTEGQRKRIDDYYDDMVDFVAEGDENVLRERLAEFGSSPAALRRCAAYDLKASLAHSYLTRNGGTILTTEEKNLFYHSNYLRFKIVYINDSVYGKYVDGVRTEEPLSFVGPGARNGPDEDELEGYRVNGGMTEEIFAEYLSRSDEEIHGAGGYPSGIYMTSTLSLTDNGFLELELVEAMAGMKAGQLDYVKTDKGVRYIYALPLDAGAYQREESAVFFSDFYSRVAARALTDRAAKLTGDIVEYPENFAAYTVETIPCNLDFKLCSIG